MTFWTYRRADGHLDISDDCERGRVLYLYSTEYNAAKKCPPGGVTVAITIGQLNSVHIKDPLYGVCLDQRLMVWPDFVKILPS